MQPKSFKLLSNFEECKALLRNSSSFERFQNAFNKNRIVIGCAIQGSLVALISFEVNELHPYWAHPLVFVESNYRKMGIGKELIGRLTEELQASDFHGLETGLDSDNYEVSSFVESCGFKKVLDCHCLELDLNQIKEPDHSVVERDGYSICSFRDSDLLSLDVNEFLVEAYIKDHFWSESVPKEDDRWNELLVEYDRDFSFVIHDGDEIKAAVAARIHGSIADIWWSYSLSKEFNYLQEILLSHLALEGRRRGIEVGEMELDSTKNNYSELSGFLKAKSSTLWQIYHFQF